MRIRPILTIPVYRIEALVAEMKCLGPEDEPKLVEGSGH
jgi:hypothetical protein